MYQSKFRKKKHLSKRSVVLLASLMLVVGIAAGATAAYIFTNSAQVTNTFIPAEVKCQVLEDFNNETKSDVKIRNLSNVDAYIRAMVFVNWSTEVTDGNGKTTLAMVPTPAGGENITFTSDSAWVKSGEYYYYTQKVPAGGTTTNLIDSIEPTVVVNGVQYKLVVDIIAEAIQAEPDDAVSQSWGVIPTALASSGT